MPTEAKRATVAELSALFASSSSSIVADYRGLSVSQIGAVRRLLREQGIRYHVVKNRLARIAADQAGVTELSSLLVGPSAVALGGDLDESGLARAFLDAVRPYKMVTVRGAVVRGRAIPAADVARLAELPSRAVLLAQLAGAIASPLATMAGLLAAPLRNLGAGLAQLAEQRAASAEA
ncbi:MAG: 50S ribosomal protein L10 [Candidatus Limnocylindrales bacterium]